MGKEISTFGNIEIEKKNVFVKRVLFSERRRYLKNISI